MFRRLSHWTQLAILAALNLVMWVGLAVVVGLLASDEVDLGVETRIRQQQPTVVAIWQETFAKATAAAAGDAATASRQAGAKSTSTPVELDAHFPPLALTPSPEAADLTSSPDAQRAAPKATRSTPEPNTSGAEPAPQDPVQATPAKVQPTDPAKAQPEATLVSRPLLMTNPQFSDPARLNQEMAQSEVGRAVQLRYSETALNQEIQALLSRNPELPYRNVSLDLRRNQAIVTADVTILGLQVGAQVVSTVDAKDCRPTMEIASIAIEGVFTPRFVLDKVRGLFLNALNWYPADYPLCLEQIVLEEDGATVYGRRR